jgi:hypothetical protein
MKLLDQVVTGWEPMRANLPGGAFELGGSGRFAAALAESQARYLLRDEVRDACREIARDWHETRIDSLVLPAGTTWLEWSEEEADGPSRRTALLVRAEAGGRRGIVHFFREDEHIGAELAEAFIRFDLDRREREAETDDEALCLVAPHAILEFEADWAEFFSRAATPHYVRASLLRRCAAELLPRLTVMIGLVQLLGNPGMGETRIDRQAVNRARLRNGRPALLDHVELGLGRKARADRVAPARRHAVRPSPKPSRASQPGLSHARI